jgi:hypothetical protein
VYFSPQLTINRDGHLYLLWLAAQSQQGRDVLVSRSEDFGASWSVPLGLKPNKGVAAGGHKIATGPKGRVYVVWREWDPATRRGSARLHFIRSLDFGREWDASPRVVSASGDVGFPQLLTDQDGGVYVAALSGPRTHRVLDVMSSYDLGETFSSAPTRLNPASAESKYGMVNHRLTSDGENRLYVVWEESMGRSDFGIYLSRSLDRGKTWTSPTLVSSPEAEKRSAHAPQVVAGPTGQVCVAWVQNEYRYDIPEPTYGIRKPDRYIFINRSLDYGRTWLPTPIRLNNPVDQDPLVSAPPQLSCDRRGHVYAAWIEGDHSVPKRLLLARSSDAGINWTDPKVRVDLTSSLGGQPARPWLLSDEVGHIWVVWQEISPDKHRWQLLVNRSDDGGMTWQPRATVLADTSSPGIRYKDVSFEHDGRGRLYVAWDGDGEKAHAIYLNRSTDFGATWLSRGVEIGGR